VEVGANNGGHTSLFASVVKRVIAFEAHPSLTGHHVTAFHPNVKWIQKAVSNCVGISRFNISTSDDGSMMNSSSLREITPHLFPEIKFYPIEVETTTLDNEVVAECIDLIWMDVQGAELEVLQGATESLKRTKMVSIEFHESQYCGASSAKDVRDLLLPYGFTEIVIAGDRSVFIHD
jgi:FkbM family methyltransferase